MRKEGEGEVAEGEGAGREGGGRGNLRSVATIPFRASLFRKTWGPSREEEAVLSFLESRSVSLVFQVERDEKTI